MVMMVVGAALTVLGVAWLLSDGESPPTSVPEAVSTTAAVTDGSVATVEDLLAGSPTATTSAPVTDDSVAPTTGPPRTTMAMQETLEQFVAAFGTATEADDFDFLWSRIHPAVIERAEGDEELCRAWVEREILALGDYQLLEVVDGPAPFGDLENVYTVAISFTFEGESFDGIGQYVAVDGRFLWLGQCR
jgi:hypothetical protein